MQDAKMLRLHGLMLCMPDAESLALLQTLSTEHAWMQAGMLLGRAMFGGGRRYA